MIIAGTTVYHGEYLLMLEDLYTNPPPPPPGSSTAGDQLGELTLMDTEDGKFLARWDSRPTFPRYATNEPATGLSPSPEWRRVFGTGTQAWGGWQGGNSSDIGYRIDDEGGCNYVDMYVSWNVLHNPSSLCLVWATDIYTNNLDQAPNCDRPTAVKCIGITGGPEPELDFGDAIDPTYPTYNASNGARHIIGNISMGVLPDKDDDGQPNPAADGDDSNGDDDEDGVIFLGTHSGGDPFDPSNYFGNYTPGQTGGVSINVSGSVNIAYVHGWIDWNNDGDWIDAGENIIPSHNVTTTGTYVIPFTVPAFNTVGTNQTYARFRLDDQDLRVFYGLANNGEVEDYTGFNVSAPSAAFLTINKSWELFYDGGNIGVPDPGDVILYTMNWSNPNSFTMGNVTIRDEYDPLYIASVGNINGTPPFANGAEAPGEYRIYWPPKGTVVDSLGGDTKGNVSFQATLNGTFPAGSSNVRNTAWIFWDDNSAGKGNVSDCACFFVSAAPVLSVNKTWQDLNGGFVEPGDTIRYTINYSNEGNAPASVSFTVDNYTEHCETINVLNDGIFGNHSIDNFNHIILWPESGEKILPAGESGFVSYDCTLKEGLADGTQASNNATLFSQETGPKYSSAMFTIRSPIPVGGLVEPVDKLSLLAPWLGLAALMAVAIAAAALVRRSRPS